MYSDGGGPRLKTYAYGILIVIILAAMLSPLNVYALYKGERKITYKFVIDEDGAGNITIEYVDSGGVYRNSWIVLPKNLSIEIHVKGGKILSREVRPAIYRGQEYVFYNNFTFIYRVYDKFELEINYEFNISSLVVEPYAFFLSPQIGFPKDVDGEVYVYLPKKSDVDSYVVYELSIGKATYELIQSDEYNILHLDYVNNMDRVAIEYEVSYVGGYLNLTVNRFYIHTPVRYLGLAKKILGLYNRTYPILRDLFGFDLSNTVEVILFPPKYSDFVSGVAGFVPFEGGRLGAINLNMIYFRTLKGNIEITAIHELAHHFIWAMGVDPRTLWIHEGLATYISIEVGDSLGYSSIADEYRKNYYALASSVDSLGFVQGWGLEPYDTAYYYAAAFFIFEDLGKKYGGLEFYSQVFRRLSEYDNIDTYILVSVMDSLVEDNIYDYFKKIGFYIEAPINIESIRVDVENIINKIPNWAIHLRIILYSIYSSSLLAANRHLYSVAEHLMKTAKIMGEKMMPIAYSTIALYLIGAILVVIYVHQKKVKVAN